MEDGNRSTGQTGEAGLRWAQWARGVGSSLVRQTEIAASRNAGGEQSVEVVGVNLNALRLEDGTAALRFAT